MTLNIRSTVTLNNGVQMPVFGLGTWRSEPGKVKDAVEAALRAGYRHIDAAHCYENQEEVGAGIAASGVPRAEIFVTTKLWLTHLRPDAARELTARMLKELRLEYVDQLLIHWPIAFKHGDDLFPKDEEKGGNALDTELDVLDTWKAMEELVDAGKARSIGVSNFSEADIKRFVDNSRVGIKHFVDDSRVSLDRKGRQQTMVSGGVDVHSRIKPATNQVEIHPYFNNKPLADYCKSQGVHMVAYCPLGSFDPTKDLPSCLKDPVITDVAKRVGKSTAQVIIRWHLQNGETVIPKSVTPSRIVENSQVFDFTLSPEDMAAIDALGARRFRICNPTFGPGGAYVWPEDTSVF